MNCQYKDAIDRTRQHVRNVLGCESTGHDWWHIQRVYDLAMHIANEETKFGSQVDLFVVQLSALLHDIADWKFQNGDESIGPQKAREWLTSIGVDASVSTHVSQIIKSISFKGAGVDDSMSTIEGSIVQDADRLDALGAIGIARCFATGAKLGNTVHNPETLPTIHKTADEYKSVRSSSVNHFYEKLFLLRDRMKTSTGKRLAEDRHNYMENYIERFLSEWNGEI
jgi:uncharacterized protein